MKHYISQSEVDSFLSCERKHWYSFGKMHSEEASNPGIASTHHSDSLTRGTVGHQVLEDYYEAIKQGQSRDSAYLYARGKHIEAMGNNADRAEIYTEILNTFISYHKFYSDEEYEPLVIEHEFQLEVKPNLIFPFKPDAVFRDKSTGKIYIVDHKFLYRKYQDRVIPILPQMLRYAKALKLLGFEVHGYMYNMLSTDKRAKPENRFHRVVKDFDPATLRKMDRFWDELSSVQMTILSYKSMPREIWDESVRRNASSFSCTNCPFLELCTAELEGQHGTDLMVKSFFESNKYGYGRDEEDV